MKHAMLKVGVFGLAAACLIACSQAVDDAIWHEAWATTDAFKSPESAAIARKHDAIFISNVKGYEKNGEGFISRLSFDGAVKDLVWLEGLNAPTGLAVDGDTLWAVDFDRLAEIDIPTGEVRAFFPAPDERPLLNDVAVSESGEVFVTGSASNSVYHLKDGALVVWLKDNDNLATANGVYATSSDVVVAAYNLVRVDRATKKITLLGDRSVLNDLEGVKADGAGGYYVSAIGDRPLYQVTKEGNTIPLFEGREFIADFDLADGLLVAPTSADTVIAFEARKPKSK